MKLSVYLLLVLTLLSCRNDQKAELAKTSKPKILELKYAEGFSVKMYKNYKVIEILKPWPESQKTYSYAIANKNAIVDWKTNTFNGIINTAIKKIVVTSTTHIPALELLGVEHTLIGFPGTDYISSEKTRKRIDEGKVRELGKNEGINTEVLLELNPDIVIGFGVDGINKTFETIKKAGIPVIYNGDWVESSALARAEWIKVFGVLFNKEKEADSIFNQIEKDYLEAKEIAQNTKHKPTILSGAMNGNIWELPNGSSFEAQFLYDANLDYLWKNTNGKGSLKLSFETVFDKARDADLWLNPSYFTSFEQLKNTSKLYTNFKAFKTKNIYTFSNKTGAKGGVLYYELGTARPDLVLKDIIKICHPNLLEGYTPYFFKKLN